MSEEINDKRSRVYDIGLVPQATELEERFLFPFNKLNYLTNGGILDRLTLITSSTDNGKTTLASQILCGIIRQGYKVAAYFGEDRGSEAANRLYRQYIPYGKDNYITKTYMVSGKPTVIDEYFLASKKWDEAHGFFSGKLFLYNTRTAHDIENIILGFEEAFKLGCRVFVLDNLENVEYDGENENKRFKDIAIALRDYAINKKVHIIIVAHVRKMEREIIIPSIDDVKGSSAVANTAKNVISIIRTDKLDKDSKAYKRLSEMVAKEKYCLDSADAVLFVLKTKGRKLGLVALNYNRITNTYSECGESKEEEKPKFLQQDMDMKEIEEMF